MIFKLDVLYDLAFIPQCSSPFCDIGYIVNCDTIKRNESLFENVNFYSILAPLSQNFRMLLFDANPITIGYLVTEL